MSQINNWTLALDWFLTVRPNRVFGYSRGQFREWAMSNVPSWLWNRRHSRMSLRWCWVETEASLPRSQRLPTRSPSGIAWIRSNSGWQRKSHRTSWPSLSIFMAFPSQRCCFKAVSGKFPEYDKCNYPCHECLHNILYAECFHHGFSSTWYLFKHPNTNCMKVVSNISLFLAPQYWMLIKN